MVLTNNSTVFGIPDIVWLINEIFVWLGGDQEAITCVNIEDNI